MTVSDVIDWHASLKGDKNRALRTLRSILAGAVAEGLAPTNVAAAAEIRAQDPVRAVTREQVLSDEQMDSLRQAVPDRYRLMIDLLAVGLRMGEVCGLRRDRVNLRGDIRIDNQLTEVGARSLSRVRPRAPRLPDNPPAAPCQRDPEPYRAVRRAKARWLRLHDRDRTRADPAEQLAKPCLLPGRQGCRNPGDPSPRPATRCRLQARGCRLLGHADRLLDRG